MINKKKLISRLTAAFIGLALVMLSAACTKKVKVGEVENAISFASLTEAGETSTEEMTSADVTMSMDESTTIPTIKEQPYTPEMELAYFSNLGIVSEGVSVGNLRDYPSTDGNIIGRFYSNTGMEVLSDAGNGWLYVSSGGLEGYVYAENILTGAAALQQAMRYENMWVCVTVDSLNVRMEPSTDTGIVARIIYNQTYRVVEDLEGWYRITIGTEEGYISKDHCRAGFTLAQAENWNQMANITGSAYTAINYGMQYLGLPYILGGEDMSTGVDCSYFVGMCMIQAGVRMRRVSIEQAEQPEGYAVSLSAAQPGDLMFYATHGNIDHVAIYIGDGKILHAAQSIGCVSISAYNYCGEPVLVKRFLNN